MDTEIRAVRESSFLTVDPLPDDLNFPVVAEKAFNEFRKAGMNIVTTADPIH